MEEAVSEKRKAFAAAHRSNEVCPTYISASRRASSVIAKTKVEAWQATCSFKPWLSKQCHLSYYVIVCCFASRL